MSEDQSMAEKQVISAVVIQSEEFEKGLNFVIKGAVDAEIHPIAIAVGCCRSMIRIMGAIALANDFDEAKLEGTINELVASVFEDLHESFENAQKLHAEKAAA